MIAYHGIFQQVDHIVRYYESRRCAHPLLTMSQRRFLVFLNKKCHLNKRNSFNRYIQYLCDLASGVIERPHFTELIVKAVNLSPVPLFNRERFV